MTPEEKARIEAETAKLKAETVSLKKGGWGKPASWIPMLAAIAAIATSLGQLQYSSIKEKEDSLITREDSLKAREKAFEARVEEKRLLENNSKLEARAQELAKNIQKSTFEILQLKEEIVEGNNKLLEIAEQKDTDGSLVASVQKDISRRTEQVESIVASAESRNLEVQIQNLVWQMNSDVKAIRLEAVSKLIEDYKENSLAISFALDMLSMPQLLSLSASGRINVLVYLRNTEQSSWTQDLKHRADAAIQLIRKRSVENKDYIGPQTEDSLRKLEQFLQKMHNKS